MAVMMFADLSDDQRYQALISRDVRFDGLFIVGVRTTGIYCRPSCPTPIHPKRKNVDFYPSSAAAHRAGLRACKRCRPDASPGSPEWNSRDDLVGRAMRMIGAGYLNGQTVASMAAELGTTERHLRRVMNEELGAPPLAIARAQRAQTARLLIETTEMRFTDVAFAAGFASLRQFNDTIRAVFAQTPTELRRSSRARAQGDRTGGTDRAGTGLGVGLDLRLAVRAPLATDELFGWWSRRTVTGVERIVDHYDGPELQAALALPRADAVVALRPRERWVDCRLELVDIADLAAVVHRCRTMFDLDADPVHIDAHLSTVPALAQLVARRPGLRCPGAGDGFASLVFTVMAQQRSLAAARTLTGRLVARSRGVEPGTEPHGQPAPFPRPAQVGELDLADMGLTKRNQATIRAVAARFTDRVDELSPLGDRAAIGEELLAISGIGPWTVRYFMMRVMRDPDVYCAGDLVADRQAAALGLDKAGIDTARPWRSYLTHHLWASAQDPARTRPTGKTGKTAKT